MRLVHTSDLHIGKRVNGLSMIDEQKGIVDQIVRIAGEEGACAILIAGDVFDRPNPSREALEVCEKLFVDSCSVGMKVFAVPGNHDSAQQLSFCADLMASSGMHIAKAFDGCVESHVLEEDGERAVIHLLPFVRPTDVRMSMPDAADSIATHDDAVKAALEASSVDASAVNILIAHQFVTAFGADTLTCESETLNIGGADNVDVSAFDPFDYVALGHLHRAQNIGAKARYSGSPLKYSFSEVDDEKSITIVEIEDGAVSTRTRALVPMHDMREVKCSYEELKSGKDEGDHQDYMRIILTDEKLVDAMSKLRVLYPNVLRLEWADLDKSGGTDVPMSAERIEQDPVDLFRDFFEQQTGRSLGTEDLKVVSECFSEAVS